MSLHSQPQGTIEQATQNQKESKRSNRKSKVCPKDVGGINDEDEDRDDDERRPQLLQRL